MKPAARIISVSIVLVGLVLSGCAVIQPWEREHLSDPIMIFDQNPLDKGLQEHHLERREGSSGGTGSQSGGCGCG